MARSNRNDAKLVIVLSIAISTALLVQGCATATPKLVDCSAIDRVSVKDSNRRFHARGFSVLPPSGGHWCRDTEKRDIGQRAFFSNPFLGTYVETLPSKEQAAHTFVVGAIIVNVKTADISSPSALKSFMKRWLEDGQGFRTIDGETYVDFTKNPRFKSIRTHVERDDSYNADCVRYQTDLEERNNPGVPPDWVLSSTGDAIACRHPNSDKVIVQVVFSERRRKGHENLEARRRLRDQADATLRSLEFSAL